MTVEDLETVLWDDFICDLPDIKFSLYPGLDKFGYIAATTDIDGSTDLPLQNFKDIPDLLDNFQVNGKPLKLILPLIDMNAIP